jgi:hypothetical protein
MVEAASIMQSADYHKDNSNLFFDLVDTTSTISASAQIGHPSLPVNLPSAFFKPQSD